MDGARQRRDTETRAKFPMICVFRIRLYKGPIGGVQAAAMKQLIKQFCSDASAAKPIEYALIASRIAIVVAVGGIDDQLTMKFSTINTSLR